MVWVNGCMYVHVCVCVFVGMYGLSFSQSCVLAGICMCVCVCLSMCGLSFSQCRMMKVHMMGVCMCVCVCVCMCGLSFSP